MGRVRVWTPPHPEVTLHMPQALHSAAKQAVLQLWVAWVTGQGTPAPTGCWMMQRERDCEQVRGSHVVHAAQFCTMQFASHAGCAQSWKSVSTTQVVSRIRVRTCLPLPHVTLQSDHSDHSVAVQPAPATRQLWVRVVTGQTVLQPRSMMARVLVCVPLPMVTLHWLHRLHSDTRHVNVQLWVSTVGGHAAPPPDGSWTTNRVRVWKQVALVQVDQAVQADTSQFVGQASALHFCVSVSALQKSSTRLRDWTPTPQVTLQAVQSLQSVGTHSGVQLSVCVVIGQFPRHPFWIMARVRVW